MPLPTTQLLVGSRARLGPHTPESLSLNRGHREASERQYLFTADASGDLLGYGVRVRQRVALPEAEHSPAISGELLVHFPISFHVARDFGDPPVCPIRKLGFQTRKTSNAPAIPVPEVTVDEHGDPSSGKSKIRLAWKLSFQPIANSVCPESPSDRHFSRAAPVPDCRHDLRRGRTIAGHEKTAIRLRRWLVGLGNGVPPQAGRERIGQSHEQVGRALRCPIAACIPYGCP